MRQAVGVVEQVGTQRAGVGIGSIACLGHVEWIAGLQRGRALDLPLSQKGIRDAALVHEALPASKG